MSPAKKAKPPRIVDSGIWSRRIEEPQLVPATIENLTKAKDSILEWHGNQGIPEYVRTEAVEVLRSHGVEIREFQSSFGPTFVAHFVYREGSGMIPDDDDERYPEIVRDAAEILKSLCMRPTPRMGFIIGGIYARMLTRKIEPVAVIGRKSHAGARAGGKAKKIPIAEKLATVAEWDAMLQERKRRHPEEKIRTALRRLGIDKSTYYAWRKLQT